MDLGKIEKTGSMFSCFWCLFGYIFDVLSVSMSFSVNFCIYEHIFKYVFGLFSKSLKKGSKQMY